LNIIGELAAVLTSISWSGTSVLFTKATQQVGSIIVNRIRVILALVFLMLLNWAFYGYLLPVDAGVDRWVWFALSGAIGYALGDVFLFQSFLCIGTQRGMLMMSLAPLMSAGLAWMFFGETLIGTKMPNLTYLLVFDDMAAREKNWATFRADPEWKKLSVTPGYTDLTGVFRAAVNLSREAAQAD